MRWRTTAELADEMRVSVTQVKRWVAAGLVRPARVNPDNPRSPMRFSDADVAQLVAELRPPVAPETQRRRRRRRAA